MELAKTVVHSLNLRRMGGNVIPTNVMIDKNCLRMANVNIVQLTQSQVKMGSGAKWNHVILNPS
jgi:hypothetical protein